MFFKNIFFLLLGALLVATLSNVNSFSFSKEKERAKYLILQEAFLDCKSFNVVTNKTSTSLTVHNGKMYCEEDPFCKYFLFNKKTKEIRLCYDNIALLKKPQHDESWTIGVKESVFENFAPSLVNAQGICNHKVETFFFNTLKEAIEKQRYLQANFMTLNFQSKANEEGLIQGYFCEALNTFVERNGFVIFDFTKVDKPHQSCLRVGKCGLRGSIQPDDSKYEEGINPGDVVEALKI